LDHQNNYIERLSVDDNAAKSFNILTSLNVLHNYFHCPNKIIFGYVYLAKFLYFSKTVLSMQNRSRRNVKDPNKQSEIFI